jgi:hypothetical protein
MKIIRTKYLPHKNYDAINLFGLLFCHPGVYITEEFINHERIHTRQMIEMAFIPYYIWYIAEWLIRIPMHGRAYMHISFEQEAYDKMSDLSYLHHRRPYAWFKYLKK